MSESTSEKEKALGKLFIDHGGDLDKISRATGIKFKDGITVKDSNDFAKGYLDGSLIKKKNIS
jgi:hypothetical protein